MPSNVAQKVSKFFADYPTRIFDKSELLIRAEEPPAGVFYIVEGQVSHNDITQSGKEVVVNVFKPGAFFPMMWAINHTPNHYFFEAGIAVITHLAPASEVVTFLQANPDVLFDLLARVYTGTDGVLRRMAHLMGGDAKSRLLFELLNAVYRFGQTKDEGVFVALSESDLANRSGLTRETINRTMRALKNDGLVRVVRGGFMVPEPKKLEAMLGDTV